MTQAPTEPVPGGCLCGRIRFEVRGPFGPVANCHCSMCRKAQGGGFATLEDDGWGGTECVIELADGVEPDALTGLEAFSHVEVLYVFDRVKEAEIERGARHPRGNAAWPRVGIFAQRAKGRPNRLGASVVPVRKVDGRRLVVAELDAVEGTPVVDIKPVMRELLPRGDVRQPEWATMLMRDYWTPRRAQP